MSLRDRILAAQSEEEITKLLAEGEQYKFASFTTKRKWDKAIARRLTELKIKEEDEKGAEISEGL
jgi:hypothetical protein